MPVVAVAAAAVAWGVAAEVGFTTFAVIAAVGATISAVGAVTGIQALTIAGGVIGAVGAIGGLASAAGLFGTGALSGAGGAAGAASPFTAEAADAGIAGSFDAAQNAVNAAGPVIFNPAELGGATDIINTVSGQVTPPGEVSMTSTDVNNPLGGVAQNAAPPDVMPDVADNTGIAQGSTTATNTTFGDSTPDTGGIVNTPATPPAPGAPSATPGFDPASVGAVAKAGPVTFDPATGTNTTSGGIFGDIGKLIMSPGGGRLAAGVIQAGSAFLSGATSSLTPAQVDALRAQAAANQAGANLSGTQNQILQRQAANAAEPIPTARNLPVTGTPQGLINTPRPTAPPVTGQVAA